MNGGCGILLVLEAAWITASRLLVVCVCILFCVLFCLFYHSASFKKCACSALSPLLYHTKGSSLNKLRELLMRRMYIFSFPLMSSCVELFVREVANFIFLQHTSTLLLLLFLLQPRQTNPKHKPTNPPQHDISC